MKKKKKKYLRTEQYINKCIEAVKRHNKEDFMKSHTDFLNSLKRRFNSWDIKQSKFGHKLLLDFRKAVKKIYRKEMRPCPFI